jgi:oligoribonuclease
VIVEIATIITDDELAIIAEGPDLVVHQPDDVLARMDPFVVEMHTRSGLLDQIKASTISLQDAGAATLEFIKSHVPEPASVPLCGNSIGTDRRFLAAYLPDIENHLHYRSIDVSSVKELVKRWYPGVDSSRPRGQGSHRALDDIRESIREMAYYREHVFVAPPAGPDLPVADLPVTDPAVDA